MSNLLIIAQNIDENDDHRGFFIDWLKEFAKNFDTISVITLARGSSSLPPNVKVYSLGKEYGASKLIQAIRFYGYLSRLVPGSSGIFAHASPIFVIASWPLAFVFRKKIVLWYLHRSITFRLKVAEKLCYKIATAAKEGIKIKSKKLVETGHGIDTDRFRTSRNWNVGTARIISVGRITAIKNLETLISAAKILKEDGVSLDVKIVGQPVMERDHNYLDFLKKLAADTGLDGYVKFLGFVQYRDLANLYKEADVSVGPLPSGGIDKAMLESMASGLLVLTSNEAFKKYFGEFAPKLIFRHNDSADLADKLKNIISLSPEEKEKISKFLVQSVREHHLLEKTISRLSDLFKQ